MSDTLSDTAAAQRVPAFYRSRVGAIGILALHDGTLSRERAANFIRNAEPEAVEAAFTRFGVAPGQLTLTFTALALELADQLVLIDTGFGDNGPPTAGRLRANLAAAGHAPEDVGTVLISHFHTDHISGLVSRDDRPVYANARIKVPRPEWDYWMNEETAAAAPAGLQPTFALCRRVFGALEGRIDTFEWGESVLDGVTAVEASGHTPGQTGFDIRSEGERLLFVADVTNNPLVFARHPDWQPAFDIDPERAVATRQAVLGAAAEEKTRLFFFHAPFPGIGYVAREGEGFAYLPEIWRTEV